MIKVEKPFAVKVDLELTKYHRNYLVTHNQYVYDDMIVMAYTEKQARSKLMKHFRSKKEYKLINFKFKTTIY